MNRPRRPISVKQMRRIVAVGKKHAKTAYPNPDQTGCPDPSLLRAMAYRNKRLSVTALPVSHVASCSPCFCEYSRQRRNAKLLRVFQVGVGGLMVIGIVLAVALFVRKQVVESERSIVPQQQVNGRPSPPEVPPSSRTAGPTAPLAVIVDLSPFSPVRSEQAKAVGHIELPPKLLRVTFLMPIGSEPGEYRVRLTKQENEALVDLRSLAQFRDGVASFDLDLNLQAVPGNRLTLMIQPSGGNWRESPLVVGKR